MPKRDLVIWAVVDATGELIGAYTNRLSAVRRIEYLNTWSKNDNPARGLGPFSEVRCAGTWEGGPSHAR